VICEIDVRDILPSVRVPTLVIRHIGDVAAMVSQAQQYMADRMPGARYVELPGTDQLAGIAVHTAARVSALAEPREVLVSRTVRDLVAGSGLSFAERGSHVPKGVPGERDLFAAA